MKTFETPQRGITIIELAVTMAVFALLVAMAAPNFGAMIQNARVRSAAEYVANGLRQAQSEAVKQNRVVAFIVTNAPPTAGVFPAPVAANSLVNYWYAVTVPWTNATLNSGGVVTNSNVMSLVANGDLSANAAQVTVSSSTPTLCFSPYGRLTGLSTSAAVACNLPANNLVTYAIAPTQLNASAHPLQVNVSLGGQVRMCDPAKASPPATPDGC